MREEAGKSSGELNQSPLKTNQYLARQGILSDLLAFLKATTAETREQVQQVLEDITDLSSGEDSPAINTGGHQVAMNSRLSTAIATAFVHWVATANLRGCDMQNPKTSESIKFYELADHLHKMKGRIVYRGDCAKDEHGAAAVYQELGANPTSVQGLNACLAYGSLPGNRVTAADAVKAYVQALLSSKYKTWIELPPELRPKYWKQQFVKPVVLLIKALYGHPDAGGLWEQHLKVIIKNLGGQEVLEYPGNFYFPDTRLLLSTYVDDLTLAGPADQHDAFWSKLTSVVDIEPPEPIYRILGRNHVVTPLPKTEGHKNVQPSKPKLAWFLYGRLRSADRRFV